MKICYYVFIKLNYPWLETSLDYVLQRSPHGRSIQVNSIILYKGLIKMST